MKENHFSFLVVGKTQESTEGGSSDFKRYIGLASCHVLAVNPSKEKLDELQGYESTAPVYTGEDADGKYADIMFLVKTDPAVNNGIEVMQRAYFRVRARAAKNGDGTKTQVIDQYGNTAWLPTEDANNGTKPDNIQKLDKFRIAADGEAALIDFLKKFLNVPDAFNYVNGSWVKKEGAAADEGQLALENIKDLFNGNFKEILDAVAMRPNNKIKLLWGVQTKDGKMTQKICTTEKLMLANGANSTAIARLESQLADMKSRGKFANIEYKVQDLQEYTVEPTNLDKPVASSSAQDAMPW